MEGMVEDGRIEEGARGGRGDEAEHAGLLRTTMPDAAAETKRIEIRVPSDPAYMAVVRQVTAAVAGVAGLPQPDVDAITLAVDEACTNVIKHAYHCDYAREMILSFEVLPDRLQLSLRDFGTKCEVSSIKGRDLNEIRPGGLGVHIIRGVMDLIEYDTRHDHGTELKMTRFLKRK